MTLALAPVGGRRPSSAASRARAIVRECDDAVRRILAVTAAHFRVEAWQIVEQSRYPDVIRWRYVAITVARETLAFSYPRLAREFRVCSMTAIYAVKTGLRFSDDIAAVRRLVERGAP